MEKVPKKTSTMSVTISSCSRESPSLSSTSSSSTTALLQKHSSLTQPLCISPQTVQKTNHGSGKVGPSPSFVKVLHDVSTVKGQLVVLECRIRGNPPIQVSWCREGEEIIDSADFRILRKKASSASILEELCTLVITEAYPEDSGAFKCTASNPFGTVSCSAILDVYTDQEEILGEQVEPFSESSYGHEQDDPLLLQDSLIPPPEWPDYAEEETETPKARGLNPAIKKETSHPVDETQQKPSSQVTEVTEVPSKNTLNPPPKGVKNNVPHPFLPSSKETKVMEPRPSATNMPDLPTFSPSLYPPSAFHYERPSHFIQSMSSIHTPDGSKPNNPSHPSTAPASSVSHLPPTPTPATMCSSMTLIPPQSNRNCGKLSPADFLSSVLPSLPSTQSKCISKPQSLSPRLSPCPLPRSQEPPPEPIRHKPALNQSQNHVFSSLEPWIPPESQTPTAPSSRELPPASQVNYKPITLPRPILKKTVSRPVSRTTDEDIQGSKDALIQEIEQKLRNKAPQSRPYQQQKISYEERMAKRLLGADNAASVFDLENSALSQPGYTEDPHSGGIWLRKKNSRLDCTEASTIQEKCFAPRFIQVPQDLTVEEGRLCRIDFKVAGLPTPDISWYLDGKPIRPDDYHKMLVCEKSVHSFIIEIVTIHHAGVYECIAKNRAGESRFSLNLDVIAQEQLYPPTFVVKMRNSRTLEGDAIRLECKVNASPTPQVYWKKDKEMLRIDPTRMSLSQDSSGKQCLVIDPVRKSDAGWYTVSAINEAGMSTCNARLDVATRLNKISPPARPIKGLPIVSQFSTLCVEPLTHSEHSAPLYESEEL